MSLYPGFNVMVLSSGQLVRRLGSPCVVVRDDYQQHHSMITSTTELRSTLRAGKYTSLGSYPLFFLAYDGECLCFDCVRKGYREQSRAFRTEQAGA